MDQDLGAALASAMNTAGIARQLKVTPKTVSNHVSNILVKLRATDRTQAAVIAREAGFGGSSTARDTPPERNT